MRTRNRLMAIAASAVALGGMLAPVAQADIGQCPSGAGCAWTTADYGGSFQDAQNGVRYTGIFFVNQISSVKSNGNTNCSRFWDGDNYTGDYIYFSRPARGGIYQDPNLTNGGGYGSTNTANWNDRIGSMNWQTCPL
jgi:hypothetical protein